MSTSQFRPGHHHRVLSCDGGHECPPYGGRVLSCDGGHECPPYGGRVLSCNGGHECPPYGGLVLSCDGGHECPPVAVGEINRASATLLNSPSRESAVLAHYPFRPPVSWR